MSVIYCVSGDKDLADTDSMTDTPIALRGAETKGYRFLDLGQEQESGERSG